MKKNLKKDYLIKKINRDKDEVNEIQNEFIESIKEMIEEHKMNNELFYDKVLDEKIDSKTLIYRATEKFSDKKTFVAYLTDMSNWIKYQIDKIEIIINEDDIRLKEFDGFKTDSLMLRVLKLIAIAESSNNDEEKKIYYMIARNIFIWVNKFGQMYASKDIFPYKYFGEIENFVEEILVKYY